MAYQEGRTEVVRINFFVHFYDTANWHFLNAWQKLAAIEYTKLCTLTFGKNSEVSPDNKLLAQTMLYNLLQRVSRDFSCSRYVLHSLHGNCNLHLAHSSLHNYDNTHTHNAHTRNQTHHLKGNAILAQYVLTKIFCVQLVYLANKNDKNKYVHIS